jgi:hypothetical protein
VTHVALADHSALGVVLWHAVGTGPRAVLAADAGVRAVQHDPGHGILRVGVDGTALQAGGLDAVIAPHRQVRARGLGIPAPFNLGDTPPVDRRRISVLLVARDDAALAPDAQAHVDVESVLFAGRERADRHARRFRARQCRGNAGISARQDERHPVFCGPFEEWQRHGWWGREPMSAGPGVSTRCMSKRACPAIARRRGDVSRTLDVT